MSFRSSGGRPKDSEASGRQYDQSRRIEPSWPESLDQGRVGREPGFYVGEWDPGGQGTLNSNVCSPLTLGLKASKCRSGPSFPMPGLADVKHRASRPSSPNTKLVGRFADNSTTWSRCVGSGVGRTLDSASGLQPGPAGRNSPPAGFSIGFSPAGLEDFAATVAFSSLLLDCCQRRFCEAGAALDRVH